MAALFALVYPDQATAEKAEKVVEALQQEGYLRVLDSAKVTKDANGKASLHDGHPVRSGTVKGLIVGGLIGVIFAIPVAGIAAGTAAGAALARHGKHQDAKDFEAFAEGVKGDLQPNGAAILLLAETDAPQRIINDLGRLGGQLRSTDFSPERIAEIQMEIDKLSGAEPTG